MVTGCRILVHIIYFVCSGNCLIILFRTFLGTTSTGNFHCRSARSWLRPPGAWAPLSRNPKTRLETHLRHHTSLPLSRIDAASTFLSSTSQFALASVTRSQRHGFYRCNKSFDILGPGLLGMGSPRYVCRSRDVEVSSPASRHGEVSELEEMVEASNLMAGIR